MEKMIVAGTPLDRRSKALFYKDEIVRLYNEGYTARQLGEAYGVHPNQIYRYTNYEKYLEQCRKDTARYIKSQTKTNKSKYIYDMNKKWSKAVHDEYIQYLIKCKNKFRPSANPVR